MKPSKQKHRRAFEVLQNQQKKQGFARPNVGPITLLRVGICSFLLLFFGSLAGLGLFGAGTANATAGINQEMSFEGKIVNSSGTNISDGTYNMEFKIYSGCSNEPTSNTGCTLAWTEDYLVSQSDGVSFTSGTYEVNLGQYCPFGGGTCSPSVANDGNTNSGVNWNSYPLYLSLQIGSTSSCSPSGNNFQTACGGDGEMNPYVLLTSTPYAFNSGEVGGFTASQLGQLAANQVWTGTNTIEGSSTSAFQVENSSSFGVLNVNTSSGQVTINNGSGSTISSPTAVQEWDVNGTNQTTLSVSPHTVGNLLLLAVEVPSGTATVASVAGGGVSSWSQAAAFTDATDSHRSEIWEGVVTATGSSTITISYSVSPGAAGELAAQEFNAGTGTTWSVVTAGHAQNASSGTVTYPSLTATQNNQMYWGYMFGAGALSAGSTSGFTYAGTSFSNLIAYNPALTATTNYTPTATSSPSGYSTGSAVIISAMTSGSGNGLTVNGGVNVGNINSTTAFQVQNASGTNIFAVDTSNGQTLLGTASSKNAQIVFYNATNSNTLTIAVGATAASTTITYPSAMPAGSVQQGSSFAPLTTYLTADSAATTSTTLGDITASGNANDALKLTIPAGKTVQFRVSMLYVTGNAANTAQLGWKCSNTSQASTGAGWMDFATGTSSIFDGGTTTACGTTAAAVMSGPTAGATTTKPLFAEITGSIKANAGSATTVTFEYASTTSSDSTTIKAGSYIQWWD